MSPFTDDDMVPLLRELLEADAAWGLSFTDGTDDGCPALHLRVRLIEQAILAHRPITAQAMAVQLAVIARDGIEALGDSREAAARAALAHVTLNLLHTTEARPC